MLTKICAYCGELKPVEQFRSYYNDRKGRYKYCKTCEKIEARRKYLKRKEDKLTNEQKLELDKIETLYKLRAANGLEAPGITGVPNVTLDIVEAQLSKLQEKTQD